MLFEHARVIERYNSDLIWVETQIKTSCNACQHNKDCGTGIIAKSLTAKTNRVLVQCKHPVLEGETITLAVPEQGVVNAALLLYGLPLIMFMFALMISSWVLPSVMLTAVELLSLLIASFAGYLGFRLANILSRYWGGNQVLPQVVEQMSSCRVVDIEETTTS